MAEFESVWSDLQGVPFSQGYLDAGGVHALPGLRAIRPTPRWCFSTVPAVTPRHMLRNLEAHAEHFSTWSIDMLGHGYTDKPGHPLEVRHYVAHLMAFLYAIGAEGAHISGESLGGWVGARRRRSPRSDRPAGAQHRGQLQADPEVMKRIITLSMAAAENPTWETVQARIKWLMADKSKDYDDIVASRQRVYRQPGFVAAMKDIMALQDPEIRARNLLGPAEYGAITAPTLVVWTSDDPTDVTEGRRMASMIPGARFEVMPGCGHWPQYEDPKTFNSLHLDFLLGRLR